MSKDHKWIRAFNKRVTNPILRGLAHRSRGHFALIRHVGRRSGKTYETPIMVFRVEDGFVMALTYGPNVDWYRNIQAADQSVLFWHKHKYILQKPVVIDKQTAWRAFPPFVRRILQIHGTLNFVEAKSSAPEPVEQ